MRFCHLEFCQSGALRGHGCAVLLMDPHLMPRGSRVKVRVVVRVPTRVRVRFDIRLTGTITAPVIIDITVTVAVIVTGGYSDGDMFYGHRYGQGWVSR